PLATPPLASGPYRITSWKMGQNIVSSRVKAYWAANLPVNRGRRNFDTIRSDYSLEDNDPIVSCQQGSSDLLVEIRNKKLDKRLRMSKIYTNKKQQQKQKKK
ncbi:ABC transporter substrate-binding protein, partial [Escherichia coli]|uniref:ABC transporter substrate-binding protein n=1 Tax=Escherichia coli TaxID=562 RepID=UPI00207B1367